MHDLERIEQDPAGFDASMVARGDEPLAGLLISLNDQRRELVRENQLLRETRNREAKEVGRLKSQGLHDEATSLLQSLGSNKSRMAELDAQVKVVDDRLSNELSQIPNRLAADVPFGKDEGDNQELSRWGEIREFDFTPLEHFEVSSVADLMDFTTAIKLSGARFVVLKGVLAQLERALGQYMLDLHTNESNYLEVSPPVLVRNSSLFGTGQLPKFQSDLFLLPDDVGLIPTSEVPLTNFVREEIVSPDLLPIRLTALTQCFRREAGAAGRDTRGMLRQHQFAKVELVSITSPETSEGEHERMTQCAEMVLKGLELPFRKVILCSGDMGFAAAKTYDLEVWMPGQHVYREISSCSNCYDFQARRMMARTRDSSGRAQFVHTLNGSGVAIGRCLIAVIENYQMKTGEIEVPKVLRPYLRGMTKIS